MAQVITTILLDNTTNGLRLIEMANWSGKAFVVPRAKLRDFRDREDSQQPGLYFLFGDGDDKPKAYIGQSESVVDRLFSHDSNREEDEWNVALVFVGDLDSALIKYLESISLSTAKNANRYTVFNAAGAKENRLSEAQKINVSEYFERIRSITGLFGYRLFDEIQRKEARTLYYFEDARNKDASAIGALLENGEFIVNKGSKVRLAITDGLRRHGKNVIALREVFLQNGMLKKISDSSYELTDDYIFTSPSMAATTVAGRACNGWTCWKDQSGRTLDENVRR